MSPIVRNNEEDRSVVRSSHKADPEFLQKILRIWENDPCLEVSSVDQKPACGQGVNFMSVVKRLVVSGTRRNGSPYQISLVSKNLVEDKCHQEIFQSVKIFANEARVYRALPTLLGKDQKLVPNSLYVDAEFILLEDMKSLGFTMADKMKSLDFDHAKLVLETLAKFHAASFVLEYTEPERYAEVRKEVKEVVFPSDGDHEGIKSMFSALPPLIIFYLKAGATPEDDHSTEIAYFEDKGDRMYQMIKDVIRPKKYAVMCAGDCWITNLLFRYEDEFATPGNGDKKVAEVRLLDFQGARFASVAIDILYFLHTSVTHRVIEERLEELLETYHSVFTSKMSSVPQEVLDDLSMDWLKNELKTHELYGFFMSLWVAPATTMDEKHTIDGNMAALLAAENSHTPEYMKDKLSAALLARIHDKCKYFLK